MIMKDFSRTLMLHAVSLLGLSLLIGCGDTDGFARVPVSGHVEVDGRPLEKGLIRLMPEATVEGPTVQTAVVDGEFEFDSRSGPVAGKHRVEIEATDYLGFDIDDEVAFAQHMQSKGALPPNPIPPQFNQASQLTADVSPDRAADLDFSLLTGRTTR
jgi:hypothetical protein